jgi:putative tryptophan/tyrosine transport system substrate-binding protein
MCRLSPINAAEDLMMIRRREFIAGLAGGAAWPVLANAQSGSVRRIGVLLLFRDDPMLRSWNAAFERGLREQGWTIGVNLLIDYRILAGDLDRLNTVAAELVAQAPDVLFTAGAVPLAALRKNTRSLPMYLPRSPIRF